MYRYIKKSTIKGCLPPPIFLLLVLEEATRNIPVRPQIQEEAIMGHGIQRWKGGGEEGGGRRPSNLKRYFSLPVFAPAICVGCYHKKLFLMGRRRRRRRRRRRWRRRRRRRRATSLVLFRCAHGNKERWGTLNWFLSFFSFQRRRRCLLLFFSRLRFFPPIQLGD